MDYLNLGHSGLRSSRLVYGCMRIAGDGSDDAREAGKDSVRAALDADINHFDHADIYGGGRCESIFGELLAEEPGLRQRLIITSKCGIRGKGKPDPDSPGRYDFSADWIADSVDGSLERLRTDYLDLLLLHRPDYLCDPEEVAETFTSLQASGKVRHFGVSNFRPSQVAMLQACCPMPLLVNQVEINIHRIDALTDGTLDQCLELGISPQSWCPLGGVAYPAWGNTFSDEDEARLKEEFTRQVDRYGCPDWVVILVWLLRHPASILPIIGTTRADRIQAATQALDLDYTRDDWYRLLEARNGKRVP